MSGRCDDRQQLARTLFAQIRLETRKLHPRSITKLIMILGQPGIGLVGERIRTN
jgi:hypothetical protein